MVTRPFVNLALTRATIIILCASWLAQGGHQVVLVLLIALQVFAIAGDYAAREVTR